MSDSDLQSNPATSPFSTLSDSALQSNRAPTSPFSTLQLLYYNSYMSSGLLPPSIQATNLCQLCCLLEGETNPFHVIADVGQDMFQLKDLIQGKKSALRVVDASDIVLWKVSMFQLPMHASHSRCVARQSYRDQTRKDPLQSSSAISLRVFRQPGRAYGYHLKSFSSRCSQGLFTHYRGTTNW